MAEADDERWEGDAASASLMAYLNRVGASVKCPSCGHADWELVDMPEHTAAVPLVQDNGGWVAPPARVPAYVLVCRNCAFIRMHAKINVERSDER